MTVAGGAGRVWASPYFSNIFQLIFNYIFNYLSTFVVVFVGPTFCDCCRWCGTSMGQPLFFNYFSIFVVVVNVCCFRWTDFL